MGVQGERFTSSERRTPLAAQDRICAEPGCGTRLSVYNDLEHCSLHAPIVAGRMWRRKVLNPPTPPPSPRAGGDASS